jgi:hypothetical protein
MLHGPGVPPGVQLGDAVGVAVAVGVGDCAPPPQQKISIEAVGTPVVS